MQADVRSHGPEIHRGGEIHLHGLGHAHPEPEISNAFLEALDIGTDEAWILERVGIRSRRTVLSLDYIRDTRNADPRAAADASVVSSAALARPAAELALARAGLGRADVGLVVAGSSAPETCSPAEACNVAAALDLDVPAFDVSSACTSFFAQLQALCWMRPEALPRFVLLVVPETMTRTVDYRDRATAVLWGDGAAAAVVSTRERGRASITASALASRPAGAAKVVVPRAGHFHQQGQAVQRFAIEKTTEGLARIRAEQDDPDRPLHFVGHQANLRVLEAVCRQCDVAPERHHSNLEAFGNTGAAGAPSVLSMAWDKWTARDDVAVAGVGSGLTWASFLAHFHA